MGVYITAISFSYDDALTYYDEVLSGGFSRMEILFACMACGRVDGWSALKTAKEGDICLFYHSGKRCGIKIRRALDDFRIYSDRFSSVDSARIYNALLAARITHERYGGTVFAIGSVSCDAYKVADNFANSQWFVSLDNLHLLYEPVSKSELGDLIRIPQGAACKVSEDYLVAVLNTIVNRQLSSDKPPISQELMCLIKRSLI